MNLIEQAAAGHKRVHFIGIGGIMMNALALELKHRGAVVTGSDKEDGDTVKMLRKNGIPVQIGHAPEVIDGAFLVVRNAAIKDDFPDIMRARELGIPILERPQVLGMIMREYEYPVCVAGTHGKSTTSAMITHALISLKANPTAFLGAMLPEIGGAWTLGAKKYFVAEACEYCDSFLSLCPFAAVILNVEEDHMDYFSSIGQIISSFSRFAALTPENGLVVVNADDANAMAAVKGLDRRIVTLGRDNGQIRAENVRYNRGCALFELVDGEKPLGQVSLLVPGDHNVMNALAAAAVMLALGFEADRVIAGINNFTGVLRRFQRVASCGGIDIYDDYAHHPSELEPTLKTARKMDAGRVICCFQPHTYTRTRIFLDRFAQVLKLADKVFVADIYAAREVNNSGVSSKDLVALVPGAEYAKDSENAAKMIAQYVREGDLVITCGAGDIFRTGRLLAEMLKNK